MRSFSQTIKDLASTPFCTTAVTMHPQQIKPRVKQNVKHLLHGRGIPPGSGQAALVLRLLKKFYEVPRIYLADTSTTSRLCVAMKVTNTILPDSIRDALKGYIAAERVAIRMDPRLNGISESERRYHPLQYRLNHGFLSSKHIMEADTVSAFYCEFEYVDCFKPLRLLIDEFVASHYAEQIKQAIDFLDGTTPLTLDLNAKDQ